MKPTNVLSSFALPLFALLAACSAQTEQPTSTVESAASSTAEADAARSPSPGPSIVTLKAEECTRSTVSIPLGARLVIDAPVGSEIDETMNLLGDALPNTRRIEPGSVPPSPWVDARRTTLTYDLSTERPELYVRQGRFLIDMPKGPYGQSTREWAQCFVAVSDPHWRRVRAEDFFASDRPDERVEQTKDLGVIPRGTGLLLAVNAPHGRFIATPDTPEPARKSTIPQAHGFSESLWVFEGMQPGAYSVDVEIAFPGYGVTLTHVEFEAE